MAAGRRLDGARGAATPDLAEDDGVNIIRDAPLDKMAPLLSVVVGEWHLDDPAHVSPPEPERGAEMLELADRLDVYKPQMHGLVPGIHGPRDKPGVTALGGGLYFSSNLAPGGVGTSKVLRVTDTNDCNTVSHPWSTPRTYFSSNFAPGGVGTSNVFKVTETKE